MSDLIKMTWPNMIHHLRKMFLKSQFICQHLFMKENRFFFFFFFFLNTLKYFVFLLGGVVGFCFVGGLGGGGG